MLINAWLKYYPFFCFCHMIVFHFYTWYTIQLCHLCLSGCHSIFFFFKCLHLNMMSPIPGSAKVKLKAPVCTSGGLWWIFFSCKYRVVVKLSCSKFSLDECAGSWCQWHKSGPFWILGFISKVKLLQVKVHLSIHLQYSARYFFSFWNLQTKHANYS